MYGHRTNSDEAQPMGLDEVTIAAAPATLRRLAVFLNHAADRMGTHGPDYGHEHFQDFDSMAPETPTFIVSREAVEQVVLGPLASAAGRPSSATPGPAGAGLTDEELDELERLCNAATPGPWQSFVEGRDHSSGSSFVRTAGEDIEFLGATSADQDFIASARQAVPRLLREIRALRRQTRQ
jgi:hypothetical protein